MDKGIDTAMMQVLRQLPRNSRIVSAAVRHAAISASPHHSGDGRRAPKPGLVEQRGDLEILGQDLLDHRQRVHEGLLTMSSVEEPFLMMDTSTPRFARPGARRWSARGQARTC